MNAENVNSKPPPGGFSIGADMPMSCKTIGIKEAQGKIKFLQNLVRDVATRKAVIAASNVIADAERSLAPVLKIHSVDSTAKLPGTLRDSIQVVVKKYTDGFIEGFIGPKHGAGRAAHLVEFGHRLVKGGKSRIKLGGIEGGGKVVGFVPAHPFLRPAFDANAQRALDVYNETMETLMKELR
jgi:HK97 gp10 family phage protein